MDSVCLPMASHTWIEGVVPARRRASVYRRYSHRQRQHDHRGINYDSDTEGSVQPTDTLKTRRFFTATLKRSRPIYLI